MLALLAAFLGLLLAQGDSTDLAARANEIGAEALRAGPIAGLSIGIARGKETVFAQGFGYADLENEVLATEHTVYRIGSLTKQFTALAILQLREAGQLAIEDLLVSHLPDYPTQGHVITIHHLLNHTSGIKSYTRLGPTWLETVPLDRTTEQVVSLFKNEPFDFAPGTRFAYNNSGYFLLGMIIERVSGKSYADYVEQKICAPIGMTSTCYGDEQRLIKHRAQGYQRTRDGKFLNDHPISMTQPYAAGALCSSVVDLLIWQRALVEYQLVSDESYALMTTGNVTAGAGDARVQSYGYGLFVGTLEGHPIVSHGGGINGFVTQLAYYPDDDLTIAVLTNTEGANAAQIEERIARVAFGLADQPGPSRTPALPARR